MSKTPEESLADFGRKYRTLFVMGELECPGAPRAERLCGKGQLLLGEFVIGFYKIREATHEAVKTVKNLKQKATDEIRTTYDSQANRDVCRDISEELNRAVRSMITVGAQKMDGFSLQMVKFRARAVDKELDKIESRVKELDIEEHQNKLSTTRSPKGRISSIANNLKLIINFSADKTSQALSAKGSTLESARIELSAVQEISAAANKTQESIHICSLSWSVIGDAIQRSHVDPIEEDLAQSSKMDQQIKNRVVYGFSVLDKVLSTSVQKMDNIHEEVNAQYGLGRGINKRIDQFKKAVARTSGILEELHSAKSMARKNQKGTFSKEVQSLAELSLDQLRSVAELFEQWIMHLDSGSTGPLPFIDDAIELNTDTTEAFERGWNPVCERIHAIISSFKECPQMKSHSKVTEITSPSEALSTLQDLKETFYAITGFSLRLPLDLLAYDRRSEGAPRVDSGLAVDPFAIAPETVIKTYGVLRDEIARLKLFLDPDFP